MYTNLFFVLTFRTIYVHNMFSWCSELVVFMYWTDNSVNNLSSYCGLVDARKRVSDKYLPVKPYKMWSVSTTNKGLQKMVPSSGESCNLWLRKLNLVQLQRKLHKEPEAVQDLRLWKILLQKTSQQILKKCHNTRAYHGAWGCWGYSWTWTLNLVVEDNPKKTFRRTKRDAKTLEHTL